MKHEQINSAFVLVNISCDKREISGIFNKA